MKNIINIITKTPYTPSEKIKAAQYLFSFREQFHGSKSPYKIDARGKFLGINELRVLVRMLDEYEGISELYLGDNQFGDEGALELSAYLKRSSNLQILNLQNTGIGDEGIIALSEVLKKHPQLYYLDLYANKISSRGIAALGKLLPHMKSLRVLNLRYNCLQDAGVKNLLDFLPSQSTLERLYLGSNGITSTGLKDICKAIENNISLQALDLGTNNFSFVDISKLATSLNGHPSILSLNLERNYLGDEGGKIVANLLRSSSMLKMLNLRYSQVGPMGIKLISEALTANRGLEELYLGGNLSYTSGAEAISSALVVNKMINTLDLENNVLWTEGARALAKGIALNTSLQELRLKQNGFRDEGVKLIASALKENKQLKKIDLEENSISDEGAAALATAIDAGSNLILCNIKKNSFTPSAEINLFRIEKVLERNSYISLASTNYMEAQQTNIKVLLQKLEDGLAKQWGNSFKWKSSEVISEAGRRNLIIRAHTLNPIKGMPSSFIIKKVIGGTDEEWDASRFINELTGLQFLTNLQQKKKYAPKFYGVHMGHKALIIEDMGTRHISLVDYLASSLEGQYVKSVLQNLSHTLAQMHMDTAKRQSEFNALLISNREGLAGHNSFCTNLMKVKETALQSIQHLLPLSTGFQKEIEGVVCRIEKPEEFKGYVHGDLCPDNLFIKDNQVYLFDFESGHYGHILLDLSSLRMNFPSCWCALSLPKSLVKEFENSYRDSVKKYNSLLIHDSKFYHELAICCAFWIMKTLGERLVDALKMDKQWGISSVRNRILAQLDSFIEIAELSNSLPELKNTSIALLNSLERIWGIKAGDLPLYPAFINYQP